VTAELRPVPGSPGLFEVWGRDFKIGLVRLGVTGSTAVMVAQLEPTPRLGPQEVGDLVMATVQQAQKDGATAIEFPSDSVVLRHEARRAGLRGGLRTALGARTEEVAAPVPAEASAPVPDRAQRTAWLCARLADLGVTATPAPATRSLGRLAKRLSGGVGDTLEVLVAWAPGQTFAISAPDRPDLMPEGMALAADTAVAVFRRFPDQAAAVRLISFDQVEHGLKTGHYSGVAQVSVPSIHLNTAFVTEEAFLEMMRQQTHRLRRQGLVDVVAASAPVDATVAHELWHQIENGFDARHYAQGMELRRQVGLALGVQTLEHAVKGGSPNAPAPWQAAHRRLVDEVSLYATTNAREATAELFKLWWCRRGPPSPVVARFGELIDQMLPPPVRRPDDRSY
jgi:hypothetical protein